MEPVPETEVKPGCNCLSPYHEEGDYFLIKIIA